MIEESFLIGDSVIHRLDPRARVITAAVFSVVVAVSDRFVALLPSILVAVSFVFLARLSLKRVCLRLLMVNLLILTLWLSLPFTFKGETLFSLGPLTATKEGIGRAAALTVKSNAIRIEGSKATKRSETATTIENAAAIITLALGSSR